MEIVIYVITGALVGIFVGWFAADANNGSAFEAQKDLAAQRYSALEKEFAAYRSSMSTCLATVNESLREKSLKIDALEDSAQALASNNVELNKELYAAKADVKSEAGN
jgi:hypothetical protein